MLASGLDKFANGFERLASGLDRFAKGFDKFATGFLSIFKTGLVRFLIELFCEKPVTPEVLELVLSPKARAEVEINNKTNNSVTVITSKPKLIGGLHCLTLSQQTLLFNTFAILVNVQYVTLNYVPIIARNTGIAGVLKSLSFVRCSLRLGFV